MARPALDKKEKREKCINVALSAKEYEHILYLMDEVGFDSPAIFLRTSGLRTLIPPKIILPGPSKKLVKDITQMLTLIDEMRKDIKMCGEIDQETKIIGSLIKKMAIAITEGITKQYKGASL